MNDRKEYLKKYRLEHKETYREYQRRYSENNLSTYQRLQQENQQLKEQVKDLERIVGIRQKRGLISKFDREYDEEDKKKNPDRNYASITPDVEEIYVRYYELKDQNECLLNQKRDFEYIQAKTLDDMDKKNKQLKQRDEVINEAIDYIRKKCSLDFKLVYLINKDLSKKDVEKLDTILKRYKGDN